MFAARTRRATIKCWQNLEIHKAGKHEYMANVCTDISDKVETVMKGHWNLQWKMAVNDRWSHKERWRNVKSSFSHKNMTLKSVPISQFALQKSDRKWQFWLYFALLDLAVDQA